MSQERVRDARLGIGLAGLIAGLLTGAMVLTPDPSQVSAPPSPDADQKMPSAAIDDPLQPVLEALKRGHRSLHSHQASVGGEEGMDQELPEALETAIAVDAWALDIRQVLHRRVGAGTFVTIAGLTPMGRALMERVEAIHDHALDIHSYKRATLDRLAAPLKEAEIARAVEPSPMQRVISQALEARDFREERVRLAIEALGVEPGVQQVEEALATFRTRQTGVLSEEERYTLEAALGAALVRLVVDFRFLRVVGPFNRSLREERLLVRAKQQKAIVEECVALVDEPDAAGALRSLDPVHPSYEAMIVAHRRYRQMAEEGAWKSLDTEWKIHPGSSGKQARALKQRMKREGYFSGPVDDQYDDALLESVRDYQRHHELDPDGYVYEQSIRSMNVPPSRRMDQIALALQRMRERDMSDMGDYYLRVNLPLFEMHAIRDGEVVRRHRVIVGTNRLDDDKVRLIQGHINRTELFKTNLYEVIIHPDWILPERVEQGEVKKQMAEDPDYLKRNRIVLQKLDDGSEVLIQVGGQGNVLGKVKFMLERSRAIFLHDTDKKGLFRELRRDFSHGCIRVDRAEDFARWVLVEDGWDPDEVRRSLRAEKTQRGMKLNGPIPLTTEYMTVDIAPDGKPIFLTDIYGYDRAYRKGTLPPLEESLWGSEKLRPNWVPETDEGVVLGWKAAGKRAPHTQK